MSDGNCGVGWRGEIKIYVTFGVMVDDYRQPKVELSDQWWRWWYTKQ